ncbi:hypothetical protein KSS87_001024 [Heliosperma pusillum]|nr:hypothetical protein KSS87_001024 [Heliosperma pusillum]
MAQESHNHLGSVGFFSTYRPPLPLDLFSLSTIPSSTDDEVRLADRSRFYNYNGRMIPPTTLNLMLEHPKLASVATKHDVDSGRLSGFIMVSERSHGLETLHISLCLRDKIPVIFSFAEVYGTYNEVRMEDSGVIAGEYLVYVTTKDPAPTRRQPWTAVYRTHLLTGETVRLTPQGIADISPAVSPDGSKIAVASFQGKEGGWQGEIEDLMTNIYVFSMNDPSKRTMIIKNGGWPSWGSNNVIFFHRKLNGYGGDHWAVFRADLRDPSSIHISQVTPNNIKAITPAAIDENTVAVGTIRKHSTFADRRTDANQYRHVEIFDSSKPHKPSNPKEVEHQQLMNLKSPIPNLGLFRVSGVFPTFSKTGSKLAFVDNEFLAVWVTDIKGPLRKVYTANKPNSVFSPVWNKDPKKDILYFCSGPSFDATSPVDIMAIFDASSINHSKPIVVVKDGFNNAFPSVNPDEAHLEKAHSKIKLTRLTSGAWTDTHSDWSPNGKWIVFSSTRDKPTDAPPLDNDLDPGYFAVYLVAVDNPDVVVRVIQSGPDYVGHVNHPFFSPNGNSIVVASDLAAVSCDPVSLPLFNHSVRPYGDIFTVDIDLEDIQKNKDIQTFNRITHSKFENSTCTWTVYSTELRGSWNLVLNQPHTLRCPYAYPDGSEGWQMTGHLIIPNRRC